MLQMNLQAFRKTSQRDAGPSRIKDFTAIYHKGSVWRAKDVLQAAHLFFQSKLLLFMLYVSLLKIS